MSDFLFLGPSGADGKAGKADMPVRSDGGRAPPMKLGGKIFRMVQLAPGALTAPGSQTPRRKENQRFLQDPRGVVSGGPAGTVTILKSTLRQSPRDLSATGIA